MDNTPWNGLRWTTRDSEQNQNLVQQAFGACPGADPSSQGTQGYITSLSTLR